MKDKWEEMQHELDLWANMQGVSLQNQWIYEAFIELNKRVKTLEDKLVEVK